MTYMPTILSLLSIGFSIASAVFAVRTVRLAKKLITTLKHQLDTEVRLTTQLREMLSKAGVETIVTPTDGDYDLSFKVHFPSPNVVSALRAWRGPVRH